MADSLVDESLTGSVMVGWAGEAGGEKPLVDSVSTGLCVGGLIGG